uniref:Reticulon n=1 Tax=Taeniopygia guttata TaxID=59729 RepID=A0A674GKH2_TAEGU
PCPCPPVPCVPRQEPLSAEQRQRWARYLSLCPCVPVPVHDPVAVPLTPWLSPDPVAVPCVPCVPRQEPLSAEQRQRWARYLARHAVTAAHTLTRLFLVHSVPESLKFAFLFYLLTYVGAACNGLTLLAAGVVCAFTFPVLYRRHQAQIDQYTGLARSHLSHLRARLLAKLPSAKATPQ